MRATCGAEKGALNYLHPPAGWRASFGLPCKFPNLHSLLWVMELVSSTELCLAGQGGNNRYKRRQEDCVSPSVTKSAALGLTARLLAKRGKRFLPPRTDGLALCALRYSSLAALFRGARPSWTWDLVVSCTQPFNRCLQLPVSGSSFSECGRRLFFPRREHANTGNGTRSGIQADNHIFVFNVLGRRGAPFAPIRASKIPMTLFAKLRSFIAPGENV